MLDYAISRHRIRQQQLAKNVAKFPAYYLYSTYHSPSLCRHFHARFAILARLLRHRTSTAFACYLKMNCAKMLMLRLILAIIIREFEQFRISSTYFLDFRTDISNGK